MKHEADTKEDKAGLLLCQLYLRHGFDERGLP